MHIVSKRIAKKKKKKKKKKKGNKIESPHYVRLKGKS